MAIGAREAAVKALSLCRKNGAWSEAALGNIIKKENMERREAALASKLCYGVIQNSALCDFYISQFSKTPINKIEPVVRDILRISIYQMVFLTKIPISAAVNEGVKLTKSFSSKASGFSNAILRKISANLDNLPQPQSLSVKYSHPEWLVREYTDKLGESGAEALLAANNTQVPLTAQINTLKSDMKSILTKMEQAGISASPHSWLPDCVELSGTGDLEKLEAFTSGEIYIQDAAARCAVMAAAPAPGDNVLDACAAPGGKSFAAAIMMENRGNIISCDIHQKKLALIQKGCDRLGIDIIHTECRDAKKSVQEFLRGFDVVMADVPCSGMGIIRKKPEIREKSRDSIAGLPEIQLNILQNISQYVRMGGVLLYSTCTVLTQENDDVIAKFLSQNDNFRPEPFALPKIGEIKDGRITLYPHIHGTDGFYICKLGRVR